MKLKSMQYKIAMVIFVLSLPFYSIIKHLGGFTTHISYSDHVQSISMPTIIEGTVYREFKFNGTADPSDNYRFEEIGIGDITINVYDDNLLLLGSVMTASDGSWSFDASAASGDQVLVEYLVPDGYDSGPSGLDNKSDIVKVNIGSTDNNFTIGKIGEHCQDNPTIATACFPGPTTPTSTIVTIEYEDSKAFTGDQNGYIYSATTADQTTAQNIAFESETGFISGLAWDKTHNSIYSASFMKLTSKGAANNVGNIYKTIPNGNSGTTSLWVDLESLFPTVTGRSLFQDGTANAGSDPDAHNIGHIGFTDIEISSDDSEVYVFNARNRKVYIIPVDPLTGNPMVNAIDSVEIPALCAGTNSNGFSYSVAGGLGVYDGKVYASTTCTGPNISDMKGAVYSFDPSSPTVELELELDYANWTMPDVLIGGISGFTGGTYLNNVLAPWSTGLSNVNPAMFGPNWIPGTGSSDFAPWAMDIEFDIHPNGNVGMNIITKNRGIDATQTFNDPSNGGYMSKASLDSSGDWNIENNGATGPFTTSLDENTPANAQLNIFKRGQPDAKFYHGEGLEGPSANGGAIIIPGFKEIMTSNTDNVEGNYDSGFSFHDVSTGLKTRFVNLLQGGNVGFAKGNSWGDLQALAELPPIEIGNYVWLDNDNDGIQDPSEKAQPDVEIQLWKDTDNDDIGDLLLGTATSDVNGFYYFGGVSDANVSQPLAPFMTYELRVSLASAQAANPYVTEFTIDNNTTDKFDSDYVDTLISGQQWAHTTLSTTNTELIFHEFDLGLFGECDVEINNFAINSCMPNGLEFEANLNFDVVYNFAPTLGENLFIEVDGVSVSGSPFAILPNDCDVISISIPIPADGSIGHTINAYFETTNTCSDEILDIKYPSPCPSNVTLDCTNKISGIVFIDSNFDGLNNDNAGYIQGAEINAYDCENNFIGSAYSDAQGEYLIQETNPGIEYRIEFTFTEEILCNYKPTVAGSDSKTTIQFVETGTCANLGLADPNACLTPKVAVVCFARNNDPASEPTIVIVDQDDARIFPGSQNSNDSNGLWGIPSGANAGNYPLTFDEVANVGEISTTFGMEWDSKNSRLYTGTYVRAFAPVKTDASTSGYAEASIYSIPVDVNDGTSDDPEVWLNLEDLFGDDFAGTYLPDGTYPGPAVYGRTGSNPNLIGYTGLGSVKISNDNSELYVVNLKTREVLVIPINTDGSAPTNASDIKRFPVPDINCSGTWGDGRPYNTVLGLGVHPKTGRVYASTTCTGPTLNDLNGYVYSFDPKDSTPSSSDFSLELSIPLNIQRPATSPNTSRFWGQTIHAWESVTANSVFYTNDPRTGFGGLGNEFNVQHNQPWLGEIGFDNLPNGDCGMIVTERNRYHDLINGSFYVTGGVVFRACGEEGDWVLENNGQCGNLTSNVNFSFGGNSAGVYTSPENRFFMYVGREGSYSAGTLTINGEGNEIILPVLDNLFNSATSGVTWLNTDDGSRSRDIRILGDFTGGGFNNTNFTKSNNWGAIATMCVPAPIEIGNYVWLDENENGIQDACEVGIQGIEIELYQGSELIGSTITDANGEYYFNHTNVDTVDFANSPTDGFTGLSSNTNYTIQIQIDCGSTNSTTKYVVSPKDAGSGDNQDFIDSDAMKVGSLYEIEVLTSDEGCSIHTYDAGFYEITTCEITNNSPVCLGDPINLNDMGEAGESWSWTGPDSFTSSMQNPSILVSNEANEGTYNLVITDIDNCTYECSVEILVNELTPDVELTPSTICAESQFGINSVNLNSLITSGPTSGSWSDTDNTGGLTGSTFTANASHRGNTYSFTYTITGEGPTGTACDDRSFVVEVSVIDCRLDLALRKTVNDGPYKYGDTLTYNIEVHNQGAISVSNVAVYDTIPCGLLFDPSLNIGWTYDNNVARDTLLGVLAGNTMVTRELKLIIQKCAIADASNYYNSAEIYDFKDENGDVSVLDDNDSDPDDEVGNDGTPIDDDILNPNDEDDQDFENISICDLALTNSIVEIPTNPTVGDTVKFEVIIYNQGNETTNSVNVDYLIPDGYKYLPLNNNHSPVWNEENTNLASIITSKIINPNENDTLCLYLEVDNVPTSEVTYDSWTTIAEITGFTDENDNPKTEDVDSNPDDSFNNDPGGNPDDDTDDEIDGSGEGDPNDPIENSDPDLDEDDHDPTIIYVCDVASIINTEEMGPFSYGDTIKYFVEVHNQGNGDITNIDIQNIVGNGLVYLPITSNATEGWNLVGDSLLQNTITDILTPGDIDTICLYLEIQQVSVPTEESWLQIVEVVEFEDPLQPGNSKEDIDSTPDSNLTNDPGGNSDDDTDDETDGDGSGDPDNPDEDEDPDLDEDDQDTEDIEICDLALKNQIVNIPSLPQVGDTIKYEIIIYNQGNEIANSVSINYSIPNGLGYLPINNSLNPVWEEDNSSLVNTTTNKVLLPGQKDTVCLYLEMMDLATDQASTESWITFAEITEFTDEDDQVKTEDIDSNPDSNFTNDPGGNPDDETDNEIDGNGTGDPEILTEDTNPELDEDDHDPTNIYVCDVAAIIDTEELGPFAYGDTLKYFVEVHNQGNGDITNISLQNLYGEGLEYIDLDVNADAGWNMESSGLLTNIIDEVIMPNDTLTICLYMKLIPDLESSEESWLQNIEVVSFEDPEEPGVSKHDVDSTPDNNPTNDPGGNPDDDTDDETTGDGSGDPDNPDEDENPDLDEDDQDTEDIEICDLALKNSIVEIPLIPKVGDTVKYEVVIYNQGNAIANSVSIDYSLPLGLKYLPVNDNATPIWDNVNNGLAIVETNNILNPGETDTLCLYLEIDNVATGDAHPNLWLTQAEIREYTDENGDTKLEDIDSDPDDDFNNDSGGNPDDETDDVIDGNGTGDPDDPIENSDPTLDEDDHDPTIIYLCDAAAIIYTLDDSEHNYGDTIKYTVEIHNQGNGDIQNIKIQNLFGEGLVFPDSELNLETGWFLEDLGQVSLIIDDIVSSGDTLIQCIEMVLVPDHNPSDSSWLQQIEIVRFEDPNAPGSPKNDIDSTPDDDETNDSGGNPDDETDDETDGDGSGDPDDPSDDDDPMLDEDDHDPVDTKVFDLALKMQIDSMPPVLPVVPGDIMKFIIVVYNQGNTPANNIELTNFIMDDNLFLNTQSKLDGWGEVSSTVNKINLQDELLPGESDTTCIYLQLINGAMSDIITWAEISQTDETNADCYDIDSNPNDINGDDIGGQTTDETDDHIIDDGTDYNNDGITDEDDHDPAMLTVQDLALIVWADQKDPVVPGNDVKFIIRVINQGNIENHNIVIADYIPVGFELSENDNNNWNLQSGNIYTKTLSNPLPMGDTIETCIILKVKEGVDAYDLINYAEVVSSTDDEAFILDDRDIDSTPDDMANNDPGGQYSDLIDCETYPIVIDDDNNTSGAGKNGEDEDDHDPAWVPVLDLASIIYTEHTEPLIPGDDIKFLVDVFNQGNIGAENIGLTIYVPEGFYLSPVDSNGWEESSDGTLNIIVAEPLNPLEQKQLCLVLRVDNDFTLRDLIPFVEINSVMDTLGNIRNEYDLDSDPDFDIGNDVNGLDNFIAGNGMAGSDEDDHDPVVPPIMDLAIQIINTDPAPKVPGDIVKFQVSLYNQGSMTPSFFSIENYLPEGLIFNESADNAGWDISSGNPIFEYIDVLGPLESDTICIWLEVADNANPLNVTNMVEITSIIDMLGNNVSDRDIDSVSDNSNENDKGNDLYSAEDNKLEENGRSGNDEDDHDQAFVLLCQEMICISNVNISLDENCEVELTPGMFLKGDLFPPEFYEYTYTDDFGVLQNVKSFGIEDVGNVYTLKVSNPICTNSCWSEVKIEYKLPPQLDCPEDLTVSCGGLDVLGLPPAEAACAGLAFEVTLHNEVRERLDCDPEFTHRILRTYRATDEMGNFAECSHEIMLERVDLSGIMFPEWRTQSTGNAISCSDEGFRFNEDGFPLPWLNSDLLGLGTSGVPFICDLNITNGVFCPLTGSGAAPLIPIGGATNIDEDGNVILIEGEANQICNSAIFYTDIEQFSNDCIKKIIRTWEIREWWCSGENTTGGIQMIEVIDDVAPSFTCPDNFTVTTNDDCAGSVVLDSIVAVDDCMNGIIVSIDYPNGLLKSNGGVAELDTGLNMIKYIVADGCYNKDSCYMQVTVIDETEPVAICERNTAVSISPNGMTEVYAEVFDDGSWDECSPVKFEVRRMDTLCVAADTLFGKSITFCCLDVPNDDLMVVFRAYDNAGNFNDCMVNVDVQDKVAAIMTCPDDQYIDCRQAYDIDNLSLLFGEPDISDNCANTQVVIETVNSDSIDQCGLGKIIRSFDLMDESGSLSLKTCKQIININNTSPFVQDSITWPSDVTLPEGCSENDAHPEDLLSDIAFADDAYPIINGDDACSLIGWDWDDRVISLGVSGECVIIERTWTVINWCGAANSTFETFVSPTPQTITVRSTKTPVFDSIVNGEPVMDSILVESINIDCESGLIRIERTATDECSEDNLIWSYMITDAANSIVAQGDTNVILDTLTNGIYTVNWEVTNQCHFTIYDTQVVEVINLKAPTPVCRYGMNITLTFDNTGNIEDETAEIWASDLDAGSYHSCDNPIQISLSQDSIQLNKKFTCSDIGEQVVQLWVRDTTTGIQDFCTSLITVTDNGDCPDMNRADIQGEIYTESLEMIEEVEVSLIGSEEEYLTQSNGEYYFDDMPLGGDYIVNPSKDINHLEGISTLDLILIQRHILGLQSLNSPYKLIAADIDKSNGVSVIDLLELRKLILGINSAFPENTSWRFVDAEHQFVDANNPWANNIPEVYEINGLNKNMDVDFIGIKTGDVNGSVVNKIRSRNSYTENSELSFNYTKTSIEKQSKIYIPIYASNYNDISGWQTTFSFDKNKLEIVDIVSGELDINNHFYLDKQNEGWFTMSYNQEESQTVSEKDILFSIVVKAKENITSENLFQLSSKVIEPEAYVNYSTILNLELKAIEQTLSSNISVYPNPWNDRTSIEFSQPIAGETTFKFYNSNGQLVYNKTKFYKKGIQKLKIERNEIKTSGMIFVIMSNGITSSEFKMMIID